ncbi:hypothetical protein WJX79_000033 [Trebouxia sp. C0005]
MQAQFAQLVAPQTPNNGDMRGRPKLACVTNVTANTVMRTGYVLFVVQQKQATGTKPSLRAIKYGTFFCAKCHKTSCKEPEKGGPCTSCNVAVAPAWKPRALEDSPRLLCYWCLKTSSVKMMNLHDFKQRIQKNQPDSVTRQRQLWEAALPEEILSAASTDREKEEHGPEIEADGGNEYAGEEDPGADAQMADVDEDSGSRGDMSKKEWGEEDQLRFAVPQEAAQRTPSAARRKREAPALTCEKVEASGIAKRTRQQAAGRVMAQNGFVEPESRSRTPQQSVYQVLQHLLNTLEKVRSNELHVRRPALQPLKTRASFLSAAMAPIDKPCCIGTVKQGELKGKNVELGPLTTYVTGTENAGGAAVLIITDIYGFSIPNTRLFADHLAQQGFFVLLPDIFHGNAWNDKLDRLLTDMHQQYKPKSVSCIGFCWGGPHSLTLAGSDKVQAAIIAHGSFVTKELVQGAKQPIQFLFSDNDPMIGEDLRKEIEAILAKKQTPTNSKFYPGMHHGWTIRGDESDPKQKEGAADAFAEMVAFLKKHGV